MPFSPDLRAPTRLDTGAAVLRPITVADAELDYAAVMESRVELRLWQQSSWPADDFTVEENRHDLEEMEQRHAAGRAFGYTVLSADESACLGCVYVFAHDARFLATAEVTGLTTARWDRIDAAVYFWVRTSTVPSGLDRALLGHLRRWFAGAWGFADTVFVTSASFIQQVALLDSTDLERRFVITEADKPGHFLGYA